MYVQPKRDQLAGDILHQFDQFVIPVVLGDVLFFPTGERMCSCPEQFQAKTICDLFEIFQLGSQVGSGVADGAADSRVDFQLALHQFRFNLIGQAFR